MGKILLSHITTFVKAAVNKRSSILISGEQGRRETEIKFMETNAFRETERPCRRP